MKVRKNRFRRQLGVAAKVTRKTSVNMCRLVIPYQDSFV